MKAIKYIALLWLVAICAMLTSCGTSRFAQDMKYMESSMDRQLVVSEEGDSTRNNEVLYLSSVENDDVIYPELTAKEMARAEQIEVNTDSNVDVVIDLTGSRERAAKHANHKDGKHIREVEDVFEVKNQPKATNVQGGKQSKFFRDGNDELYFYNAESRTVHQAEYVGYNVLREKALTGLYIAPDAGVINYNGDWRAMAGARLGYNSKYFDVYGGIDFTSGVKNRDDINKGKVYDSKMYFARAMGRIDLSPKGTYYDKFVLEIGGGIMGERRQLAVDNLSGIAASLPANVHMEVIEGDGYTYHQGYSLIFHACMELNARITRNLHLKVGAFAGPGNEYYRGGAEPVKGKFVYGGQLSLSWFILNKWHKVNPSVTSIAKSKAVNAVRWY